MCVCDRSFSPLAQHSRALPSAPWGRGRALAALVIAVSGWLAGCDSGAADATDSTGSADATDATETRDATETSDGQGDTGVAADDGDTSAEAELPPAPCATDAECVSSGGTALACKAPRCVGGTCELAAVADGAACDDGDDCTTGERCAAGVCGLGQAVGCDDTNPCTTDACDPGAGCVHTFNQKPCDDGSACTLEDRCFQGKCGGVALGCDDGNPCTDDVCDATSGCQWKPRVGPCEDGNACTTGDTCFSGVCKAGAPPDCGENNPCLDASCDPATGCVAALVDGDCDDGSACTSGDTCVEGACLGVTTVCDDKNPCTNDFCDKAKGCQSAPNQVACDDGDPCTLKDACDLGACEPGPVDPLCCDVGADCEDGDPCTDDGCDDGYCAFVPRDCDDGFICTLDRCDGGVCSNTAYGPLQSGTVFVDSFEGAAALSPWTLTSTNADVRWQLDSSEAHTGATSLYCGHVPDYSYDYGATFATAARVVQVPAGEASLELWLRQDLDESGSCSFDFTEVAIGGEVQTPCFGDTLATFTRQTFDLTPWSGQSVTIEVRFDTVDAAINDGHGVWLDDIAIVADSPAGCCLVDEDCPGEGCEAWVCDPQAVICVAQAPEVVCDDQDPCTADACAVGGLCTSTPIDGCCPEGASCP